MTQDCGIEVGLVSASLRAHSSLDVPGCYAASATRFIGVEEPLSRGDCEFVSCDHYASPIPLMSPALRLMRTPNNGWKLYGHTVGGYLGLKADLRTNTKVRKAEQAGGVVARADLTIAFRARTNPKLLAQSERRPHVAMALVLRCGFPR
jgi:hypothetical protein